LDLIFLRGCDVYIKFKHQELHDAFSDFVHDRRASPRSAGRALIRPPNLPGRPGDVDDSLPTSRARRGLSTNDESATGDGAGVSSDESATGDGADGAGADEAGEDGDRAGDGAGAGVDEAGEDGEDGDGAGAGAGAGVVVGDGAGAGRRRRRWRHRRRRHRRTPP